MEKRYYTTQLQAGLGLVNETKKLLDLWDDSLEASKLYNLALNSATLPNVTARRLRNIVIECFAPRYLTTEPKPAKLLKKLVSIVSNDEMNQFFLLYTCRANAILADFVEQVYWLKYGGGYNEVSNEDARAFVERANHNGKTVKPWSENTIRRVSAYLTGCLADYGLLQKGKVSVKKINPFRISPIVAAYLAYDLHFRNMGEGAIIDHEDWRLFGLSPEDVREELKNISIKGYFLIQSAGNLVRISWKYGTWEEFLNAVD